MKPILSFIILLLLIGCQNNGNNESVFAPLRDSVSVTGLTGDSVKLVKTAGIRFKVTNVEQSTKAVYSLVQTYGGLLTYQHLEAPEESRKELNRSDDSLLVITAISPRADLTARIPTEHLEAFMFDVSDLGYYTGSSQLQVDDKSLFYLQNALQQKARKEVLAQTSLPKNKPAIALQTIAVRDEAIEQQIANRTIDAEVKYSTVNLNLFQNAIIRKEMIADTNMDSYQLPFSERLGIALSEGWQFFLNFLVALAHLWMFILVGFGAFFFYKYWQQKKRPKLM